MITDQSDMLAIFRQIPSIYIQDAIDVLEIVCKERGEEFPIQPSNNDEIMELENALEEANEKIQAIHKILDE